MGVCKNKAVLLSGGCRRKTELEDPVCHLRHQGDTRKRKIVLDGKNNAIVEERRSYIKKRKKRKGKEKGAGQAEMKKMRGG